MIEQLNIALQIAGQRLIPRLRRNPNELLAQA